MNLLDTPSRLRMFAGPNGSVKTTVNSVIKKNLLGFYINPDKTEAEIEKDGFLHFDRYSVKTDGNRNSQRLPQFNTA